MTGEGNDQLDFVQAAEGQRVCAVCGMGGTFFDPHHVVEKKWLKSMGLPFWHPDNALRLCRMCHDKHTSASVRVPLAKIGTRNISYALSVLGSYAADYLARYYGGGDERVEVLARQIADKGVACVLCEMDYEPKKNCSEGDYHMWALKL